MIEDGILLSRMIAYQFSTPLEVAMIAVLSTYWSVLNKILHLFKISFIRSLEGEGYILTFKYITKFRGKRGETYMCLSLPMVLAERLSVAMETLYLFDMG